MYCNTSTIHRVATDTHESCHATQNTCPSLDGGIHSRKAGSEPHETAQALRLHIKIHGEKNTSIDRIDNTKGYSKENCRWATMLIQGNNRSNNRFITYNNETLSLSEWARRIGISRQVLYQRLDAGWGMEKALGYSISPRTKLESLIEDVLRAKFGTKNRAELLLRLEDLKR